jgi:hypothetical protein
VFGVSDQITGYAERLNHEAHQKAMEAHSRGY